MSLHVHPVVLDDTDTRIQYTGQGWFRDSGSQDSEGNFGASYLHTRHGTNKNDSLTFSFNGTSVLVWGTTDLTEIPIINGTGSGTTWDPKWECFVDGVSAGYTKPFPDTENNWLLCQNTQLTEGPHTLSLNVTTMGKTFWVDQLQFTPPQGSSVGNGTNVVLVDFFDPAIVYGDGWESLGSSAKMTSIYGSKLAFNFTGTSLSWMGFIPTELSHNVSSAEYAIDGGAPVSFQLNGLSPIATSTEYNQLFFKTPDLKPAQHSLVVTYLGSSSATPLVLTNLYVTNVSLPSTSLSSPHVGSNGSGSGSVTPPSSGSSSSPHLGPILGGVVGGLSLIGFSLFAFILLISYQRKARLEAEERMKGPRMTGKVSPFITSSFAGATAHSSSEPGWTDGRLTNLSSSSGPLSPGGSSSISRFNISHFQHQSSSEASSSEPGFAGVGAAGIGYSNWGVSGDSLLPLRKRQEARQEAENSHGPLLHHEDSGVRIGHAMMGLEVPPVYTTA